MNKPLMLIIMIAGLLSLALQALSGEQGQSAQHGAAILEDSSGDNAETGQAAPGKQPVDAKEGESNGPSVRHDKKGATALELVGTTIPDIMFASGSSAMQKRYRPLLKKLADMLVEHGEWKLIIEGHSDERGAAEYVFVYGDRRARAVKDYLVSLGVPASSIDTVSYGKETPLCHEHTEECWAKNRRAHFVVFEREQ